MSSQARAPNRISGVTKVDVFSDLLYLYHFNILRIVRKQNGILTFYSMHVLMCFNCCAILYFDELTCQAVATSEGEELIRPCAVLVEQCMHALCDQDW